MSLDKAKKSFTDKEMLNVACIGHVDHGKTTLGEAIRKRCRSLYPDECDYSQAKALDSHSEEAARGVTINRKTICYATNKRYYAHTDCPGHADYVKNMIAGATDSDVGILVVSANDGIMKQTIEHVILAEKTGIKDLIVFLNKADMIDGDQEILYMLEEEVRDLIKRHGYDSADRPVPVVAGSATLALQGSPDDELGVKSIDKLLEHLDALPAPKREVDKPFRMYVDQVLLSPGRGTVVTGKIEQGMIKAGDVCEIIGYGTTMQVVVTQIEMFKTAVPSAKAGDNVGLLLRGPKSRDDVKRGQAICVPGALSQHNFLKVQAVILRKEEGGPQNGFTQSHKFQIFVNGTYVSIEKIVNLGAPVVMGGDQVEMQLALQKQIPVSKGDSITMRAGDKTIGYAIVTEAGEYSGDDPKTGKAKSA